MTETIISEFIVWLQQTLRTAADVIQSWHARYGAASHTGEPTSATVKETSSSPEKRRPKNDPKNLRPYRRACYKLEMTNSCGQANVTLRPSSPYTKCAEDGSFSTDKHPSSSCWATLAKCHLPVIDDSCDYNDPQDAVQGIGGTMSLRPILSKNLIADTLASVKIDFRFSPLINERERMETVQIEAIREQSAVQKVLDNASINDNDLGECVSRKSNSPCKHDVNEIDIEAVLLDHCGGPAHLGGVDLFADDTDPNPFIRKCLATMQIVGDMPTFCYTNRTSLHEGAICWLLNKHPSLRSRLPCIPQLISAEHLRLALCKGKLVQIGNGRHGVVLLGIGLPEYQLVTVKLFLKSVGNALAVLEEASMLARLSGSGVTPRFYGIGFLHNTDRFHRFVLVTEFIGDPQKFNVTDVCTLLRSQVAARRVGNATSGLMNKAQWLAFLADLTHGLQCIHATGIVINDLKSENILCRFVDNAWRPVFIDFGSSSFGDYAVHFEWDAGDVSTEENIVEGDTPQLQHFMSQHEHLAPELFIDKRCTTKSDVYALGRLLLHIGQVLRLPVVCGIAYGCRIRATASRCSTTEVHQCLAHAARSINNCDQLPYVD